VADGTKAHVVQAGAVNLGVVWVTANATTGGYDVMGTMFTPTGAGNNGQGFGFSAPATVRGRAPRRTDPHDPTSTLPASAARQPDLIVRKVTAPRCSDIMAAHVSGA
jgi:hypothetical protein